MVSHVYLIPFTSSSLQMKPPSFKNNFLCWKPIYNYLTSPQIPQGMSKSSFEVTHCEQALNLLRQNSFHIWDCWKDIGDHLYSMSDTLFQNHLQDTLADFSICKLPLREYSSLKACLCAFSCLIYELVMRTLVHAERKASLKNNQLKIWCFECAKLFQLNSQCSGSLYLKKVI